MYSISYNIDIRTTSNFLKGGKMWTPLDFKTCSYFQVVNICRLLNLQFETQLIPHLSLQGVVWKYKLILPPICTMYCIAVDMCCRCVIRKRAEEGIPVLMKWGHSYCRSRLWRGRTRISQRVQILRWNSSSWWGRRSAVWTPRTPVRPQIPAARGWTRKCLLLPPNSKIFWKHLCTVFSLPQHKVRKDIQHKLNRQN